VEKDGERQNNNAHGSRECTQHAPNAHGEDGEEENPKFFVLSFMGRFLYSPSIIL